MVYLTSFFIIFSSDTFTNTSEQIRLFTGYRRKERKRKITFKKELKINHSSTWRDWWWFELHLNQDSSAWSLKYYVQHFSLVMAKLQFDLLKLHHILAMPCLKKTANVILSSALPDKFQYIRASSCPKRGGKTHTRIHMQNKTHTTGHHLNDTHGKLNKSRGNSPNPATPQPAPSSITRFPFNLDGLNLPFLQFLSWVIQTSATLQI